MPTVAFLWRAFAFFGEGRRFSVRHDCSGRGFCTGPALYASIAETLDRYPSGKIGLEFGHRKRMGSMGLVAFGAVGRRVVRLPLPTDPRTRNASGRGTHPRPMGR